MSASLSAPRLPARTPARAPIAAQHLQSRLTAAVREGAVRATVAVGLAGIAAIHAVDAVGT